MAGSVTEILMGLLMAVYYAAEKLVKLFLPQAMFEKDYKNGWGGEEVVGRVKFMFGFWAKWVQN